MSIEAPPVLTAGQLADRARQLRAAITAALTAEHPGGPFHRLAERLERLHPAADLADVCAQLLVFGRADGGELTAIGEGARQLLATSSPKVVALSANSCQPPQQPLVVPAYDEFLARYDPARRAATGAVYTPPAVVEHMVRTVDEVLRGRFGLERGVADPSTWAHVTHRLGCVVPGRADPESPFVTVVDPAAGTGAYLVEWLRYAGKACDEQAWPERLAGTVVPALHAVELLPVPAMVAHSQLAAELARRGAPGASVPVTVGDALAGPAPVPVGRPVTVVIGNPPYDRVARSAGGGIVTAPGPEGRSLFDDLLGPAAEETVFSHHASLYNLYVYFWRWALAQVFEDDPAGVGVVSLVTASSWLTGPGFVGLRQLVRELADEIWVVDLGGDNKGARREENVFDIESPVAVVTVAAYRARRRDVPAVVHYRRLQGTRAEKLHQLAALPPLDTPAVAEPTRPRRWRGPLVPSAGTDRWDTYPALTDVFPWQQPGCKFGRTWPVAPDPATLLARWRHLVATDDPEERARRFATTRYGRSLTTRVNGSEPLGNLPVGAPAPAVVPYAYRSFDRQWALADARLARTESPSLWEAQGPGQLYLVTKPTMRLGAGPAAVVTAAVPDLDSFRGSFGGKDVIPLHRVPGTEPNVAPGVLEHLEGAHQAADGAAPPVTPERLFAYAYALLAGADYTERFAAELDTPGIRLPLTADPALFDETARFGQWLIDRHTGPPAACGAPLAAWDPTPSRLPAGAGDIAFDAATGTLRVADGLLGGVPPAAWDLAVSGMPVVRKWLGYRTAAGAGRSRRSTSPLDGIRPTTWLPEWSEELATLVGMLGQTLAARPCGTRLLATVTAGPLVPATALPPVPAGARRPPGRHRR